MPSSNFCCSDRWPCSPENEWPGAADRLTSPSGRTDPEYHGDTEQERCADPAGTGERRHSVGLSTLPTAAGGRADSMDEMAKPGTQRNTHTHANLSIWFIVSMVDELLWHDGIIVSPCEM